MTDDRPLLPPPGDRAAHILASIGGTPEPLALGDFRLLAKVGGGTQGAVCGHSTRRGLPG
jgi:hypothetical protein